MKKKYDVLIITFTTTLVFLVWKFIDTLFTGTKNDIILWIIGFVSSVGVYRSIVFLFHSSLKVCEPIKRFFLGNEYLNGIWLGYYIDTKGEKKYIQQVAEHPHAVRRTALQSERIKLTAKLKNPNAFSFSFKLICCLIMATGRKPAL